MSMSAGLRLGPYEIVAPLGAGGMGEVYRARDSRLNRDVALKFLPEAFSIDPDRLGRFRREAQVLASINHPNIAAIYGVEESGALHALVLELVEGPTLADRIARGVVPIDETIRIAQQLAAALEAAHDQGIVHRDLKPANIKVRDDGTVKVLDFGLAKLADPVTDVYSGAPAVTQSPTLTTPAMTQFGMILGTAAYMSPEQAKGRPADKRSDLWAYGCVLYEMLTGTPPFVGEDVSDTLAAVLRGQPDWSKLPPATPPALVSLIKRCLEKDRRERVGDVAAAVFVLRDPTSTSLAAPLSPTNPARRSWLRRAGPPLLLGIVVAAVAAIVGRSSVTVPEAVVTRFSFVLPEGQTFLENGSQVIAISPDGKRIAYTADQRLYVRSLSEPEPTLIPGPDGRGTVGPLGNPAFSPDGQSIAFGHGGIGDRGGLVIKRVPLTGGSPVTIANTTVAAGTLGLSWTPEGILFVDQPKGITRLASDGSRRELLVPMDDGLSFGPQLLPGGDAVLYTHAPGVAQPTGAPPDTWDKAEIVVHDLKSHTSTIVWRGGGAARYVPTGHLVYAVGATLFAMPFDVSRRQVRGAPVAIVEAVKRPIFPTAAPGTVYYAVSDSGSLVYIPGSATAAQMELAFSDQQGRMERLKVRPGSYQFPRLSPDGTRVAVGTDDGRDANIWICDVSGAATPRQLTFGGKNRFPVWSSDGQRIAFQSDREGDAGIFVQRADGNTTGERLTRPDRGVRHVPESWSADQRTLIYADARGDDFVLRMYSFADKSSARFSDVASRVDPPSAAFAPDGRWVAYTSSDGTERKLFVEPVPPTGAKHLIATTAWHPVWSRDGKSLFFRVGGTGLHVAHLTTAPAFVVSNPQPIPSGQWRSLGRVEREYDVTPDGRRILVLIQSGGPESLTSGIRINVVLNWFEELKRRVPTH